MVARMDVLSINCPHTPSTFRLMNARRLRLMKPTSIVVITSRGEIIDENALTRLLRSGELAGAGLDAFEHGTEVNPRLRGLNNVVLPPHMAPATREARHETGEKVIINIKTFDDGHRPPDQIVPGMLSPPFPVTCGPDPVVRSSRMQNAPEVARGYGLVPGKHSS